MNKNVPLLALLLGAGNLLVSCGNNTPPETTPPPDAVPPTAATAPPPAGGNAGSTSLSDPKSSIAYQFDLIKAGDLEKLKTCLTPRVRDDLTQEIVDKAKGDAAKYSMDELYASAEMGEADGKKTAKVKMKSGRTLTTLVETDGQWLADTIWFK